MAKKHCGGSKQGGGSKSVSVKRHRRSTPGKTCHGPGKPGPKSVTVKRHRRSKP